MSIEDKKKFLAKFYMDQHVKFSGDLKSEIEAAMCAVMKIKRFKCDMDRNVCFFALDNMIEFRTAVIDQYLKNKSEDFLDREIELFLGPRPSIFQ